MRWGCGLLGCCRLGAPGRQHVNLQQEPPVCRMNQVTRSESLCGLGYCRVLEQRKGDHLKGPCALHSKTMAATNTCIAVTTCCQDASSGCSDMHAWPHASTFDPVDATLHASPEHSCHPCPGDQYSSRSAPSREILGSDASGGSAARAWLAVSSSDPAMLIADAPNASDDPNDARRASDMAPRPRPMLPTQCGRPMSDPPAPLLRDRLSGATRSGGYTALTPPGMCACMWSVLVRCEGCRVAAAEAAAACERERERSS